jgi:hypothetical protein
MARGKLDCSLPDAHRRTLRHADSCSESGACVPNDVLLQLHPSLPSLRRKLPSIVRPVHRYYGAVRLLQYVHARRTASAFTGRPSHIPESALEISRFSCMLSSQRAWTLRLRRTGQPLAINAAAVLPSSLAEQSRHPVLPAFRSSIAPPTDTSGLRFETHLAMSPARLKVRMESLAPFP